QRRIRFSNALVARPAGGLEIRLAPAISRLRAALNRGEVLMSQWIPLSTVGNLRIPAVALLTLSLASVAIGAAFQNLDFEQAQIQPPPPNYIPADAFNPISATAALPGWTVRQDGVVCTAVWGAPVALDETSVALVGPASSPIQGNYSVRLYAAALGGNDR